MRAPSATKQIQAKIGDKEKTLLQNMNQLGRQLTQSSMKLRRGEGDYVLKSLAYSFLSKSIEIERLLTEIIELKDIELLLLRETTSRTEGSKSNEEKK